MENQNITTIREIVSEVDKIIKIIMPMPYNISRIDLLNIIVQVYPANASNECSMEMCGTYLSTVRKIISLRCHMDNNVVGARNIIPMVLQDDIDNPYLTYLGELGVSVFDTLVSEFTLEKICNYINWLEYSPSAFGDIYSEFKQADKLQLIRDYNADAGSLMDDLKLYLQLEDYAEQFKPKDGDMIIRFPIRDICTDLTAHWFSRLPKLRACLTVLKFVYKYGIMPSELITYFYHYLRGIEEVSRDDNRVVIFDKSNKNNDNSPETISPGEYALIQYLRFTATTLQHYSPDEWISTILETPCHNINNVMSLDIMCLDNNFSHKNDIHELIVELDQKNRH